MRIFQSNYFNSQKGFTLLEVIASIFIITIGIVGILSLITMSISGALISKSKLIASNLNREGIEVVRNIRDSNWIEQRTDSDVLWNQGLSPGEYRVEYDSQELLSLSGNPALKLSSNGRYQYDNGSDSMFHRKISIENISSGEIKVICEVTWSQRGRSLNVLAEQRLYNWK